jgi:hypothetical protein
MAGKRVILCDTNIIIHVLRGQQDSIIRLKAIGHENVAFSIITAAELYNGAKNKTSFSQIRQFLSHFRILPLTEEVSDIFHGLCLSYTLSHRIAIPDGLIAATAIAYGFPLFTENLKDFDFIPDLKIYKPK